MRYCPSRDWDHHIASEEAAMQAAGAREHVERIEAEENRDDLYCSLYEYAQGLAEAVRKLAVKLTFPTKDLDASSALALVDEFEDWFPSELSDVEFLDFDGDGKPMFSEE